MNVLKKIAWLVIMIGVWSWAGCVSETEEELLRESLINCDTTDVSYSQDIKPILQNNCYRCHAASIATAGVILEGHNNVKGIAETIIDGKSLLVGVTSHLPGFPQMPYNSPKLRACDIIKIRKWVEDGANDN